MKVKMIYYMRIYLTIHFVMIAFITPLKGSQISKTHAHTLISSNHILYCTFSIIWMCT